MTTDLQVSRFDPERDGLSALTGLVRRAYAQLAARGLRYVGTWQTEEVTARRIQGAECWVARRRGRLVGTVTFKGPGEATGCPLYERPDVAYFGQLAVEPELQGRGIGRRLLEWVEARAVERGAAMLACDTAEGAEHLIALYRARGYEPVGRVDWDATNYVSVLLALKLPG